MSAAKCTVSLIALQLASTCTNCTKLLLSVAAAPPPSPLLQWHFFLPYSSKNFPFGLGITEHTVPEQESNISKKMTTKGTWTFYLRRLLLFARLSYYFIPCFRLTKSPTLLSAPLLSSTQQVSLVVIENVTSNCARF